MVEGCGGGGEGLGRGEVELFAVVGIVGCGFVVDLVGVSRGFVCGGI
jgi:hypothetical protein